MKTILSGLLVLFVCTATAQDLPIENADFETWDYYNTWTLDPDAWQTSNMQLAYNVEPDSASYEGEVAMRVYPWSFFEPLPGYSTQQIPTSFIPPTFSFAVKCHVEPLDSVFVRLRFTNQFMPVYTKEWSSDVSIDEWQFITLELDQIEPIMDLVTIEVIAGYGEVFLEGNPNTWISVDAMGFDVDNSVQESGCELSIFPNPTTDELTVRFCDGNQLAERIQVFNAAGQRVIDEQNKRTISMAHLPPGAYTIDIQSAEGKHDKKAVIRR
ncbi:MAG: T9SS type A sorting domain-containing protein [Flavobacteriales bacterium]|nr:T9SS type A sorting domain-containing protein [Flavobacteriales bacterium]